MDYITVWTRPEIINVIGLDAMVGPSIIFARPALFGGPTKLWRLDVFLCTSLFFHFFLRPVTSSRWCCKGFLLLLWLEDPEPNMTGIGSCGSYNCVDQ